MNLIFEDISDHHDLAAFDCGTTPLNDYLRKFAKQNHKKGISLTIVATASETGFKTVLGYYSVSSGQIEFNSLPSDARKHIPKYPIPIMRIGRLAVDNQAKGQGVGRDLLMDAFHRAIEASAKLGIFAVVVDAKDEQSVSFYKKYGFIPFQDKPMTLFILMSTIKNALP